MDTYKAVLATSADKKLMNAKIFQLKSKRSKKTHVFQISLLQIVLTDTENATLITPSANFWQTDKKFYHQVTKRSLEKFKLFSSKSGSFQKYTFFLRTFYWRRRKCLREPLGFFLTEGRKIFPHCPRATKHKFFGKFFHQNFYLDTLSADFTDLRKKFRPRGWKVCLNLPNWLKKKTFFSEKNLFALSVLLDTLNAVLTGQSERLRQKLKKIRSISEKHDQTFVPIIFFLSNCSSRHVECIFDNCVDKKLKKWARVFLSMSENDKKYISFKNENFYFKSLAWIRILQFWERHLRNLTKFLRKFHLKSEKRFTKLFFRRELFPQSDQMDT